RRNTILSSDRSSDVCTSELRGLLSLRRRHHWKLSAVQKARLHQYLAQDPVLHALYFAKQQLNGFLVLKTVTRKRAKQMLPKLLRLLEQFEHSPARGLAATLRSGSSS